MVFVRNMALLGAITFAAMPALAGTSAKLTQASSFYDIDGPNNEFDADNLSYTSGSGNYHGIGLEGLSQLETTDILFKNGVVVAGNKSYGSMTTGVEITFTNTNATRVLRPVVNSTLLAAGIGLYVTDQLLFSPPPGGCGPASLVNCAAIPPGGNSGRGAAHWRNSFASFDFDVSVDGASIYSLAGKLGTDANGNFYEDLGAARGILNDFTRVSGEPNPWFLGYSWNDTNVRIALPNALNPGESVTAVYTITTLVQIGPQNFGLTYPGTGRSESQIGYASFGDPTGGDSPISTDFAAFRFAGFGQENALQGPVLNLNGVGKFSFGDDAEQVTDPVTGEVSLFIPSTEQENPETGELELVSNFIGKAGSNVAPIPEPASWTMLLLGFGFVGGVLRRRAPAAA
jgi:hypothetical protein